MYKNIDELMSYPKAPKPAPIIFLGLVCLFSVAYGYGSDSGFSFNVIGVAAGSFLAAIAYMVYPAMQLDTVRTKAVESYRDYLRAYPLNQLEAMLNSSDLTGQSKEHIRHVMSEKRTDN